MRIPMMVCCALVALSSVAQARTFVHPGAMNTQAQLDFVKQRIKEGGQPWTTFLGRLKNQAREGSDTLTNIDSKDVDANISKGEARRAYANALAWAYTGDTTYAKQGVGILNAWSGLQGFTAGSDQDKLQAGWIGALFAPAAEILRGYPGWKAEDITKFQDMFRRAFYPQLMEASSWNGNVDLTQIDAMMNIAVFNEDTALFNAGLERLRLRNPAYFYLASDSGIPSIDGDFGDTAKFWSYPERWVDGLTQESCRDNNHHSQYALASAVHAAEVAWNQGVDVYTENTRRYTLAMELMANQILSGTMLGVCGTVAPNTEVVTKSLFATWEVAYNHYHHRKGLALPYTAQLLKERMRSKGASDWNIFFEPLTHADVDSAYAPTSLTPTASSDFSVRQRHGQVTMELPELANQVVVRDLLGNVLVRQNLSGQSQVNFPWSRSGVFLVQIQSSAGPLTRAFVAR